MKKIFRIALIVIISLLVIYLLAGPEADAAEQTWYREKADRVDNPVLLAEDEYYEGVSIVSNPISDLTYLEIPFEKYLDGSVPQMQIITFTEALFYRNDTLRQEVVLYLYVPDGFYEDTKYLYTEIELLEQSVMYNESMQSVLNNTSRRFWTYRWSKVSSYENIIKFSYSKDVLTSETCKDLLLKKYTTNQTHTLVSSIFTAKITGISTENQYVEYSKDLYKKWISSQEFNFLYEKNSTLAEGVALLSSGEPEADTVHYTTTIAYNTGDLKVEGKLQRLRFKADETENFKIFKLKYTCDTEYVDFFYYLFNVEDAVTGKPFTSEHYLKSVKYTYYDYLCEFKLHEIDPLLGKSRFEVERIVSYKYPNGSTYVKDSISYDQFDFQSAVNQNNVFAGYKYRAKEELKDIYTSKTVNEGFISEKYPYDCTWNDVTDWLGGAYKENEYKLPYLYSTNDPDYVNEIHYAFTDGTLANDYQYGMLVGKDGYPAKTTESVDRNLFSFNTETDRYIYQYAVELVEVNEITYEYMGEIYTSRVVESKVDHSNIHDSNIQDGKDDYFNSVEVPLNPDDLSGWQKVTKFFGNLPSKIGNAFKKVGNFIGNVFSKLGNFLTSAWPILKVLFIVLVGFLLFRVLTWIVNIINNVFDSDKNNSRKKRK